MESKEKIKKTHKISKLKAFIKRYTYFVFAVFIMAASYNLFILPHDLVFGGISGIAVITKNIIDPSVLILVSNLILVILSFIILGKEKTMGSILGVFLYPLFIKLTANIGDVIILEDANLLLNVIFAGFLSGVSLGLLLKNGFNTGGTDIIVLIMSKVFKMPVGKGYILVDGLIILAGGYFFGWRKVMYALFFLYIYCLISDKILLGISDNKAFYIVTDKDEEIKDFILDNLNHGVTVLKAKGGYNGRKENVLLCVVPARHYFRLKEGINLIDSDAFFVIMDAYEVKGGA